MRLLYHTDCTPTSPNLHQIWPVFSDTVFEKTALDGPSTTTRVAVFDRERNTATIYVEVTQWSVIGCQFFPPTGNQPFLKMLFLVTGGLYTAGFTSTHELVYWAAQVRNV
jgi:hypothetical protein